MTGTYDPADNLRAYADALGTSDRADALVWAETLRWAAARIRGGHASLYAHKIFRAQFGLIAEHCGIGPHDGSDGIHTATAPATASAPSSCSTCSTRICESCGGCNCATNPCCTINAW